MKYFATVVALCMLLALVDSFSFYPSNTFDFNPLGQASPGAPAAVRDPRQNRGPVLFPPSPPNQYDESSGVVVGASGYGFVPPQRRFVRG